MHLSRRLFAIVLAGATVLTVDACHAASQPPTGPLTSTSPVTAGPTYGLDRLKAALSQPAELGPTWKVRSVDAPGPPLSDPCGTSGSFNAPGSPQLTQLDLLNQADTKAEWMTQTALVYPTPSDAAAAVGSLHSTAAACPATADVPQSPSGEAAHHDTVSVEPLTLNEWTGFQAILTRVYVPQHPGRSDVRFVVLSRGNAVLVIDLGAVGSGADAHPDWSPVLRSYLLPVVSRIDAGDPSASAHA
jgi:hypothetical protein